MCAISQSMFPSDPVCGSHVAAAVMGLHHKHHAHLGYSQQHCLLARALNAPDPAGDAAQSTSSPELAAGRNRLRVLFIGLGGGTLPLALHHHFPGMDIDAVELDAAVVEAAQAAMAYPAGRRVSTLEAIVPSTGQLVML